QRRGEADDGIAAAGLAPGTAISARPRESRDPDHGRQLWIPASAGMSGRGASTQTGFALPLRITGAKRLRESIEICGGNVGDRQIGNAVVGPGHDIVAGDLTFGRRDRPAGGNLAEADQMLAHAIDERCNRGASDHVDAAADQGKALAGEIDDARRLRNAAVEPGLDGVSVGGADVGGMRGPPRARTWLATTMPASGGPGDSANQVAPLPRNAATATEAASARQDGREETRAGAGAGRKPTAASIRRARPGGAPSRGSCSAMTRRSAS